MAVVESSTGKIFKREAATAIQRAAGTEVVHTARDHWGDQFALVKHRGCTVHWGPENPKKHLEVVLARLCDHRTRH